MSYSPRYRIVLVEERGQALIPLDREEGEPGGAEIPDYLQPLAALLAAIRKVNPRGPGPAGWSLSLAEDPVAFLLSSMSDAVLIRAEEGRVLYSNPRAASLKLVEREFAAFEEFSLEGVSYERRGLRLELPGGVLTLEIAYRSGG